MCSRTVLSDQVARARERGFVFNLGMETEFYFVRTDERGRPVSVEPARRARQAVLRRRRRCSSPCTFLDEMVRYMNTMGWDVHSFDHEDGNGQYEFDFSYTHAIEMADRFMLFPDDGQRGCAEVTGYEATFMPKPWSDKTGGGAHFNMSLASVEDRREPVRR